MFKNHYVEKSQTKKNVVYDSWNNTLTKWILKAYYPLNRCRKDHWQNPTSIHDKTLSKQCMLLLSHFSRVRLCVTPWTAAHQASPSLGFSRQEHWSGLPFPSPMHESEKWKGRCSVMSDSSRPHGLQPTRLLHHGICQARVLEWGAIAFSVAIQSLHLK